MMYRIQIIKKVDYEKQYIDLLELEIDYELATLFNAMQNSDLAQQTKSKNRLTEIQTELQIFKEETR